MHRTTLDARSIAERDQPAMVSRRYPLHRGGSDRATTLPVIGQNRRAGLVRTGRQCADRQIPLSLIRYFTVTRRRLPFPDRLAEDRGAVLEERGDPGRRTLGRSPRRGRHGEGALEPQAGGKSARRQVARPLLERTRTGRAVRPPPGGGFPLPARK